MSFDTQEPLETATVKSDDDLIVHDDYRNSHTPGPRDQLAPSRFILSHVLRRKRNPMRRKKLFRRVARLSR